MELSELITTIVISLIGIFVGFAGYKCFRASITVLGGLIGAYAGNFAFDLFGESLGFGGDNDAKLVTIIIFVIVFASIAFALYKKAIIYITALSVGFWIYSAYVSSKEPDNIGALVIAGVVAGLVGLVIGYAVFALQKWAIMVATSVIGAKITATALTPIFVDIDKVNEFARNVMDTVFSDSSKMSDSVIVMGLLLISLTVAGFIIQVVNKE